MTGTRRQRAAVGLCLAAVAASGCARSAVASPPTTVVPLRPLTIGQAVQLSSTLYEDHRLGGAAVDVEVPYSPTVTVAMHGAVDFQAHAGHLEVVTDQVDDSPDVQDVDFTATTVYTASPPTVPGAAQTWSARPPALSTMPIDRILQLLVALSSVQRDNPLLVQQSQARYAGSRNDGGTEVDVYRYSPTITYWIGHDDGLLRRFIAVVDGIAGPVTIDLMDWGPHPSPAPSVTHSGG